MNQKMSEELLYKIGKDLLGSEANKADTKAVQAAGLFGVMANIYATEKMIKCDNVVTNYKTLTVNYLKDNKIIDSFTITTADMVNPKEWHNRLLQQCGKEISKD